VWEGNPAASTFYQKLGFENAQAMELKSHMKEFLERETTLSPV